MTRRRAAVGALWLGACAGSLGTPMVPIGEPGAATGGAGERAAIEAAVKAEPRRADPRRDLAWLDYLDGDTRGAAAEFERAAAWSPDDAQGLMGRALLAQTAGRIAEARGLWARVLEGAAAGDPWRGPIEELAASTIEWSIGEAPGGAAFAARLSRIDPARLASPAARARLYAARAALARRAGDEAGAAKLDAAQGCPPVVWTSGPWGRRARLDLDRPLPPATSPPVPGLATPVRGCGFTVEVPDGKSGVIHARAGFTVDGATPAIVTLETDQPWRLVLDGATVYRQDPRDRYPPRRTALDLDLPSGRHDLILRLAVPSGRVDASIRIAARDPRRQSRLRFVDGPPAAAPRRIEPARVHAAGDPDPRPGRLALIADYLRAHRALRDQDEADGSDAKDRPLGRLIAAAPRFAPGLLLGAQLAAEDPTRPSRFARDRARRLLERALALDPGAIRARYNLATLDLQDDHAEKALERLGPARDARLDYARYQALHARGFQVEAERALARASDDNPDLCPAVEAALAGARDRHDVPAARRYAERLLVCRPDSDDRAELLRELSRPAEAAAEYRRLLALDGGLHREGWRAALADALTAAGDGPGAIRILEGLVAAEPRTALHRVKLADALVAAGDAARARTLIDAGLAELPESSELQRARLALGGGNLIDPFRVDGRAVIAAFEKSGRRYDAPAVILLDRTVTRVFPTGARLTLTHNIIRVQTKEGIDKWGEVQVPEGADVLLLRAIKRDGSTREPEEIVEKQTVSVPGLTPCDASGCDYVEFEYLDPAAAPAAFPGGGFLAERFYFQSFDAPLDRTEYVLATPAGTPVQIDRRGAAPAERLERQGPLDLRTFADHGKPQLLPEPQQAPFTETVPSVRPGAGVDFGEWRDFLEDQQFGVLRGNDELRALAAKLASGAPSERVAAIDAWVRHNVQQGGSLDEAATSILARGQGSRIVLERALLAAAGISSQVFLVRSKNDAVLEGPLPDLEAFDEPVLALTGGLDGAPTLFLDPRLRHSPTGFVAPLLRDQPALALAPGGGPPRMLKTRSATADERKMSLDATLADDGGAEVRVREELRGWPAIEWREALDRLAEDRVRPEFEQHTLGFYFPGASLEELRFGPRADDDAPLIVEYRFRAPRFARREGRRLIVPAPFPALLGRRYVGVARRDTPIQLTETPPVRFVATIHLPAGAKIAHASSATPADSAWGRFRFVAGEAAGALRIESDFAMPFARVPPERYLEFTRWARTVDEVEAAAAELTLP